MRRSSAARDTLCFSSLVQAGTLDLDTDEDLDEMIAAQDKFVDAVGFERESAQ